MTIVVTKSKPNTFVIPNFSPTPDCFIAFIGDIVEPVDEPIGFIGTILETRAFTGDICDNCNC